MNFKDIGLCFQRLLTRFQHVDSNYTQSLTGGFLFLVLIVFTSHLSYAQDWPQWRGPNRDGVTASFNAPKAWPDKLRTVWKVPVGLGHSSPIVIGKRVYLHTRQDENEVVSCIDLETGKQVWRDSYATPYKMHPAAVTHGKGPKSTPVFYNHKLYTYGITGILSCYDADNGKLRWRKEFSKQYKTTSPLYGSATSPLVHNGFVIVHVGGNDSGALIAFNAETGEVKWSWNSDGPSYASPIVFLTNGEAQIVTQSQKSIVALSGATGELLWQIPFETAFVQNIVTPVIYKQTIVLSGLDKGTMSIKPIKRGSKWETQQVWQNPEVSMYMSSPVVVADSLIGLSHKRKGQFFCLDARTGQTVWATNGREGDNAAIVAVGPFLFLLTDAGELIIARHDAKQFEVLKKYSVADSPTWAHPVVAGKTVLIKDASSLALLSLE